MMNKIKYMNGAGKMNPGKFSTNNLKDTFLVATRLFFEVLPDSDKLKIKVVKSVIKAENIFCILHFYILK